MAAKSYWIKERENPQLGTYYIPEGQLSKTAAKKKEKASYGENRMIEFKTEEEYKQALEVLKANKETVVE